jgi:hypothetical protein
VSGLMVQHASLHSAVDLFIAACLSDVMVIFLCVSVCEGGSSDLLQQILQWK